MLKCITFDGDASTLNALMGYFEKLDKALADVHEVLHKEQTEQPVFVREGSKIIRLRKEEILFLEGYGDYVKIHRTNGKPLLSQVSLKRFEENLNQSIRQYNPEYWRARQSGREAVEAARSTAPAKEAAR